MIDEVVIVALKESLGGDDALIQQLIDLYVTDSPKQFADASAALLQGDQASLARAAHSLKSTSASMGAATVSALARDLEQQAKQGDLASSAAVLARLKPELDGAIAALSQLKF